jgi:hypothetical protein
MPSPASAASVSQPNFQYHFWFDLKPNVSEPTALEVARTFLNAQLTSHRILAFRLMRNSAVSPATALPQFLALIDFTDREQFSAAFSGLRTDGIHHGAHGELMSMVSNFRIELTEEA